MNQENQTTGSPNRKRYTEEFKRSVVDHLLNSGKTAVEVAREFGIQTWNLRDWKRQYGSVAKPVDGPVPQTPEAMTREIQQLRKELARVTMQRDILKKNHGHPVGKLEERYRMIKELSQIYRIRDLCEVLEVARSGYYAWRQGTESQRALMNRGLVEQIKRVFVSRKGNYGSPRVTQQLRQEGQRCNHKRVERLMRQQGLKARTSRKHRVCTTQSEHDEPIAPNRLLGRPAPGGVNQIWVADITYVPTSEGWLYVAGVMDLYSRQIIGWSVWDNLTAGGALQALKRALVKRGRPRNVIHHSDRGIQYACRAYRQELEGSGLIASMSRRGNCYDNAAMEAFWSTLKREAMAESAGWSKDRVRRELFEYIESNYNRSRLHSSLGYQSPVDFEH